MEDPQQKARELQNEQTKTCTHSKINQTSKTISADEPTNEQIITLKTLTSNNKSSMTLSRKPVRAADSPK